LYTFPVRCINTTFTWRQQ